MRGRTLAILMIVSLALLVVPIFTSPVSAKSMQAGSLYSSHSNNNGNHNGQINNGNNGNHNGQTNNGNNGNHNGQINNDNGDHPAVPEPASMALLGMGLASLIGYARKRNRR